MATEDSPSPHILYPHWQNEYQAAIVELDREASRSRRNRNLHAAPANFTKV